MEWRTMVLIVIIVLCVTLPFVYSSTADNLPFFQGHCNTETTTCTHICNQTREGYTCACYPGYKLLSNGYSCQEIKNLDEWPSATLPTEPQHEGKPVLIEPKTPLEASSEGSQSLLTSWDELFTSGDESSGVVESLYKEKHKKKHEKHRKGRSKNKKSHSPIERALHEQAVMMADEARPDTDEETRIHLETKFQCSRLVCQNEGRCGYDYNVKRARCLCELGYNGDNCQFEIEVRFPRFKGNGYLALPPLHQSGDTTIRIDFRPDSLNGVLLYSGDLLPGRIDYFSLALFNGYPVFSFDCGSGPAHINSTTRANLGRWNEILIQRRLNVGFMSLNKGPSLQTVAEGKFQKISLRDNLYIGGYMNKKLLEHRVGMSQGFVGCVETLVINRKNYDFRRQPFVGDALYGRDVDECSSGVCNSVVCYNNGTCTPRSPDKHICLCPVGTSGINCLNKVEIQLPFFTGYSYLQYQGLKRTSLTRTDAEILFKPSKGTGLLMYNGYTTDKRGDFFALSLVNEYVEFRFDLGTGTAIIRSRQPITMEQWHFVKVTRTGKSGILEVDTQGPVEGYSKGGYVQLTLLQDLYVGGHRNYDETSGFLEVEESFVGCVQKVRVNGRVLNLIKDAVNGTNIESCQHPCQGGPCLNGGKCRPIDDLYQCDCPLGFYGKDCEEPIKGDITNPQFSGNSFLSYIDNEIVRRVSGESMDLTMRIRAQDPNGLIFWSGVDIVSDTSNYIGVGLENGYVRVNYNLGGGEQIVPFNTFRMDDGAWHDVRVQRIGRQVWLEIDRKSVAEGLAPGLGTELQTDNILYIGGGPNIEEKTRKRYDRGFTGCIELIRLPDFVLKVVKNADNGQNIRQCQAHRVS